MANNLLVSLSGSQQTAPTFWLNPTTGVSYFIATSTPQYRMESLGDLAGIPLPGDKPQILGALASFERGSGLAVVSHYDVQPAIDLFGSVQGRDLGGVSRDLNRIIREVEPSLPRGTRLMVRGEIATMTSSFTGLLAGLVLAIVLVYLLIVVNFQSWTDPFIIITALPAALAGIVWMLFAHADDAERPGADGRDHVRRRRDGQQHPRRQLRERRTGEEGGRGRCGPCGGLRAVPAGHHDRAGDDHRHGADGARARRGR